MANWTRVTDPETHAGALPPWFAARMLGARGAFGLLMTTGDVLRITSITAAHISADGCMMFDVLLDHAGIPDGVDLAWRSKHFLGAPVPGATLATVNAAHVLLAVEFLAAEFAEGPGDASGDMTIEVDPLDETVGDTVGS
jgi:hypothetical protein